MSYLPERRDRPAGGAPNGLLFNVQWRWPTPPQTHVLSWVGWGMERRDFPTKCLDTISVAIKTRITQLNQPHGADKRVRSPRDNTSVGTMVVLCNTNYDLLFTLDMHIIRAHTGDWGLSNLLRVHVVDGTANPAPEEMTTATLAGARALAQNYDNHREVRYVNRNSIG